MSAPVRIPPAVAEFAVMHPEKLVTRPRVLDVEEWQAATVPVEVDTDGEDWFVVVTAHDGTAVRLPSALIGDLADHLEVLAPPICTHHAGCSRFAAVGSPDDDRCVEHARTHRYGGVA